MCCQRLPFRVLPFGSNHCEDLVGSTKNETIRVQSWLLATISPLVHAFSSPYFSLQKDKEDKFFLENQHNP